MIHSAIRRALPGPLLDPHRRCRPEALHLGGLAQHLLRVRSQGQQPVHRVSHPGAGEQFAHQLARLFELRDEVLGREGHLGRRALRLRQRGNVVGAHKNRPVAVGADLHRVVALPLVHEGVHVAHDRVVDFVAGSAEEVDRAEVGHLVNRGRERNRRAGHRGDARAPDAAGDDHVLDLDRAAGGDDGAHSGAAERSPVDLQTEHLRVLQHGKRASRPRPFTADGSGPDRVHDRRARLVEAAQDGLAVDERRLGNDLRGSQQLGLDTPGPCGGHPAAQLLHALLAAGHLDTAAGGVHAEGRVLSLTLQSQQRDLAVVIRGEDEVGRVARRSARVRQRTLVDQHEVGPAEFGQVTDDAVADDSGADDGDLRASRLFRDRASGGRCGGIFRHQSGGSSYPTRRARPAGSREQRTKDSGVTRSQEES